MAVQTITYDDKSYLNQNSTIADTNKVNDTDMNMIKSVVNNNANELTNIITNLGGQVLWTNTTPSSIDSDITINFSGSNYDMVLWLFSYSLTVSEIISSHSIKGYGTKVSNILNDGSTLRYREIAYVNDTTYTIKVTASPGALIPMYAIGYNTGLFS